jgi:hypothetical protein
MHLTPERLERAEAFLRRRGTLAIVIGRNTPGLRMATVIACGVFGIPYQRFLPALTLGAFLYILLYTLLGYFFGPPVLTLLERIHLPLGLLGSLVPLVLVVVWIVRARRGLHLRASTDAGRVDHRHRLRDGALAGGLATIVSTLLMNVLVHLAGDLVFLAPGDLIHQLQARLAGLLFTRTLGPLLLLLVVPAFMAVGVVWGAVYAGWVEPHLTHWRDWLGGMLFSLVPLAAALLVVLPALSVSAESDPTGLLRAPEVDLLVAAGETARHLVFGLVLGLTYPLRLARRTTRVPPPLHPTSPSASPATILP